MENENDNIPLTEKPVYYVNVTEGSIGNKEIMQLKVIDPDKDPLQTISYNIISGNLVGYFDIHPSTGKFIYCYEPIVNKIDCFDDFILLFL